MEAAHQRHPEVSFVGIDHNDGRVPATDLLNDSRVTFPAGFDPTGSVAAVYGLRGMPSTVFVSADGTRAVVHRGRLSAADIERRIAALTLQGHRS